MKVSIIIPTYKPKDYIWECLDSLVNQTMDKSEYEVILVLNGCKEPWENQILEFKSKYSDFNLRYFQTDYGNVSNARNIGLDVFLGEYVTFIDDDDYVSNSYLEELYECASPNTISLSYAYGFNDGHPEIPLASYYITKTYDYCISRKTNKLHSRIRHYFSGPWMKLIPRAFVEGKRFDEKFLKSQDAIYMFLISDKIKEFRFTSKNAIYYRRFRSDSAVTKRRSLGWLFRHTWMQTKAYAQIYLKGGYSTLFYITRNLAIVKSFVITLWKNVIKNGYNYLS